ncbi:MAG: nickel transporter [Propionibacteriaceae bacterium]|jgi:high-affinity nickel-transport protein|nr:nickel transporter [Propionibacteriaceae bacterium]
MTNTTAPPTRLRTLLTTRGRESTPFRFRVGAAFGTVTALHLIGLTLLSTSLLDPRAAAVTISMAAFAYARGLIHSFDFDHISMIDNSTRKFVTEGRRPASVGLAFSAGHSTVVIATGLLVITGAQVVQVALDATSPLARLLAVIGLSVSGAYLLLVATANLAAFTAAWRLRRQLRRNPGMPLRHGALSPRGPAAMIMTAPLRRVRHPRHVYVVGLLFSLGFDTSSQIALLMLTGAAAFAGAEPLSLLALPFLFTAAMTLGDTSNGLMMLKMYEAADSDPIRKINFNLTITAISICSAVAVAVIAASTLLTEQVGIRVAALESIAAVNTDYAGYLLAGVFAAIGLVAVMLWRRTRRAVNG